jgi:signal transduction histidine kinase
MTELEHLAAEVHEVSVNRVIQGAIHGTRNEWKDVADLTTELDPGMPRLWCLPAELGEAIRNLIVSASRAVAEAVGHGATTRGRITVRTRRAGPWLEVRVSDDGAGDGLGRGGDRPLRIVQEIVVGKLGGAIDVSRGVGSESVSTLRLPLEGA